MSRRAARHSLAALALCSLLAAGCTDDQPAAPGNGTESEVAANARAAAINVSLSDLPEGYAAIQAPGAEEGGPPFEGCVDAATDISGATVTDAASPTFRLQTAESLRFVASETAILSDPAAGQRLLDAVGEAPTLACLSDRLSESFARLLPRTTPQNPLTLAPAPDFPDLGGDTLRLSGSATLTREGADTPITVSTSLVLVQTGDALSVLVFGGVLESFPEDTLTAVTAAVADRQG